MPQAPTAVLGRSAQREFPRAFGILALLKPLARDERGEIYVALRPEGVDRLCVVNLLANDLVQNAGAIDTLRAQAGWLVARVHGNLVQTYDVGHVAERLFLLNEYVEGRDLGVLLAEASRRGARIPIEAAVYAALEVSAALGFIRATEERVTGIPTSFVGLSAAAVMVSREGSIKLVHHGSGLAPTPDSLAGKEGARVSLLAPEHATGGGSPRGDVYAVGALLWQMLTGRPLAPATAAAHLEGLRAGTFEAPRASAVAGIDRGIPQPLDDLVGAALAQRPEDRPESCDVLRGQLAAVVKGASGSGSTSLRVLMDHLFAEGLAKEAVDLGRLSAIAGKELSKPGAVRPPATLTNFDPVSKRVSEARDDDLPLGEVIPGSRYRVLEKLGEGGMGAVYAAEHVDIERRVALKLVHAELLRNPVVLGQFRQEARAASRIGNPYICDVTDWGELPDGRVFFVMEYLDGPSLGKVLDQRRKLPPGRCIPILRQVAKALGSAHEKGIVHLDVKPDNVLLLHKDGRADAVKVVDFGVAGILGQAGGATRVMGTPEYMAPERATGKGYDHRSDVYSLGVMAYEMLVGEVPFQGSNPVETLAMQASDPPDFINERLTAPVPAALESVIMRMLEKTAERRPQSMAEVEALLIEAQLEARLRTPWDDLALPAIAPERAARIGRKLRSTGRRTALFAAGTTLVVLSAITSAYFASRSSSPPPVVHEQAPPPPSPAPSAPTIQILPPLPPRSVAPPVVPPPPPPRAAVAPPSRSANRARREEPAGEQAGRDVATSRQAVQRGVAALESGSIELAKAEFERAVAADPRNAVAVGGLAEVAFERSKYDDAVYFADRAARMSPRVAKYQIILGDASYKLTRYADALKAYQRAAVIDPNLKLGGRIEKVQRELGSRK